MSFFHEHTKKKITILIGHPDADKTMTSEFALLYESAAVQAGHEGKKNTPGRDAL